MSSKFKDKDKPKKGEKMKENEVDAAALRAQKKIEVNDVSKPFHIVRALY